MPEVNPPVTVSQPASFWRRIGAFALDAVLIGLVGLTLGYTVTDQLARLGVWGRLLGFAVALAYFGLMNSRLGSGQTVGKKLLGIKVVDARGATLPVSRSLLRFMPLALPWFFNGAPFPEGVLFSPWIYAISVAIFGIGLSIVYLFIFNRPSRQSLHDLAVGSFVVSTGEHGESRGSTPWRGHLAVCALLIVAAAVAPVFTAKVAQGAAFAPLLKVLRAVNAEPWVATSQVNRGTTSRGETRTTYLHIVAHTRDASIKDPERASRLASLAVRADDTIRSLDVLQVTLVYGFDIGIASSWRSQAHTFAPREL